MPRKSKKYVSWMLSAFMCFSNSFITIRAEEVQDTEPEIQETADDESVLIEQVQDQTEETYEDPDIQETAEDSEEINISDPETVIAENLTEDGISGEVISDEELQNETVIPEEELSSEEDHSVETEEFTEEASEPEDDSDEETELQEEAEDASVMATDESLFTYSVITHTYTVNITGYSGNDSYVEIPSKIGNYTVVGINGAFKDNLNLRTVVIPDTVTSIGARAFSGCSSLTSVTVPGSVKSLGAFAFQDCVDLPGITIPNGVTSIEGSAFINCVSLSDIAIPASVTSIGDNAFQNCRSLSHVSIASSPTVAYNNIFADCPMLKTAGPAGSGSNIELGRLTTLKKIFSGCNYLESITIPSSVTSIDTYAFTNCINLTHVTIPSSVTTISDYAFQYCSNLSGITIPDSVTAVGKYAFQSCSSLASVRLSKNQTIINEGTFQNCTGLPFITIPDNIVTIDKNAFYGAAGLTGVSFGNKLDTIGANSFSGSGLISVTIPDNVKVIDNAFSNCENITSAVIGTGITSMTNAFSSCKSLTDVELKNGLRIVSGFRSCSNLKNIVIPDSVRTIAASAFAYSGLTEIHIPDSVTKIESSALAYCRSLAEVTVPGTVLSMGTSLFAGDTNLICAKLLDGITSLPNNAFSDCSGLTTVYIPSSLTTVNPSAFATAYQLKDIYYNGTQEQFAAISILSSNTPFKNATVHYEPCMYNHKFGTPVYTWTAAANGYNVTGRIVCRNDASHVITETVHASYEKVKTETCEEKGLEIYTAVFNDPAFSAQEKRIDIPETGHDYDEPQYEWKQDDDGYTVRASSVCRNDSSHVLEAEQKAEYEVILPETCEEDGIGEYTAVFENDIFAAQKRSEVRPASGHDYVPEWQWSDDHSSAEIHFICSRDPSHHHIVTAAVHEDIHPASNGNEGLIEYTAEAYFEEQLYQDDKNVVISADPEFDFAENEISLDTAEQKIISLKGSYAEVEWSSSDEHVVTVASDGTATGESAGTSVITAESKDGRYTAQITIRVFDLIENIVLDPYEKQINRGESFQINAVIYPETADPSKFVFTSTEPESVSVDGSGMATGLKSGVSVIRAESTNSDAYAECIVTVVTPADSISLDITNKTAERGEAFKLTASVLPADADDMTVTWVSSDENVAAVDNEGNVSAVGKGSAVITAYSSDETKYAQCTVTVVVSATDIELSETSKTIYKNESFVLGASVLPEDASDRNVSYHSSNPSVAVVDSSGNVTGLRGGTADITVSAADGSIRKTCSVTVISSVTGITLSSSGITLSIGKAYTLTAAVSPSDATNKTVIWTSDHENVARVSSTGRVTAVGKGTAVITASTEDGGFTAQCTVTVWVSVSSVKLSSYSETLHRAGEEKQLSATVVPENASDTSVLWSSSDPSVVTVDQTGKITAVTSGTAVITVKTNDGNKTAQCSVDVDIPVESIELDQTEILLSVLHQTAALNASVLPEQAKDKTVIWTSSNPEAASVDENGVVTAINNGTAVITASSSDGTVTAECTVTVEILTASISVDPETAVIERGETLLLIPEILPAEALNQNVVWTSSDETTASVDENGLVTALKSGTAVITAVTEDTGLSAECSIQVITSVRSVSLEEDEITIQRGDSTQLHAAIDPEDADNLNLNWKSSDESVVTVDDNGLLTAVERGNAVITVTAQDGGLTAQCNVAVIVDAQKYSLSSTVQSVFAGDTYQLAVIPEPADADLPVLIWSSSDETVAGVDQEGTVTAFSKGMSAITVESEDGEYRETCLINVRVKPEEIRIDSEYIVHGLMLLETGDLVKLDRVTILPAEASDAPVRCESADTDVAEIINGNLIHAAAAGKTVITVMAGDVSTSFSVVVTDDLSGAQANRELADYIMTKGTLTGSVYTYETNISTGNAHCVRLQYEPETNQISLNFIYTDQAGSSAADSIRVSYTYCLDDLDTVDISINSSVDSPNIHTVTGDITCGFKDVKLSESLRYHMMTTDPADLSASIAQPLLDYALSMGTDAIEIALNDIGTSLNALGFTSIDVRDEIDEPAYVVNNELVDFLVSKGTYNGTVYRYGIDIDVNKEQYVCFEYNPGSDKIYLVYDFNKKKTSTSIEFVNFSYSYVLNDLSKVEVLNDITTNQMNALGVNGKLTCNFEDVTISDSLPYTISVMGYPNPISTGEAQSLLDTTTRTATQMIENILNRNGFSLFALGFTSIDTASNVPMTGLTIKPASASVYVGDTVQLTAVKKPSNASGTLVWTSGNSNVAAVDQQGNVRALSEGTAVITARSSDGKVRATSTIVCKKPVNVTGIRISSSVSSVNIGDSIALSASVLPSNATNKAYTWVSLNNDIASVNQNGIVTGISSGIAVIQAVTEDGHYTALKTINVTIPVTGISFEQKEIRLAIRDSVWIDPVFTPENASNKNLNWRSLDERIAVVDQTGKATAFSEGETTIVCTSEDGGYTAHYQVKAYTVHAEGIAVDENASVSEIEFGRTGRITITFEPSNTTNQNLIWTSSDESIATVDENGVITAVGEGPVTITAASEDGNFTVSKEINIIYKHIEKIEITEQDLVTAIGAIEPLHIHIFPEDASNQKIRWSSSDEAVLTVDENGIITSVSGGTAVITAVSEDGGFTAETTVFVYPEKLYIRGLDTHYTYTGKAIKPDIQVYDSGVLLKNKTDYTLAYKNNTKAGTATITIKSNKKGNYTGNQTVSFIIDPISLNEENEEITVDAFSVQETGKKLTPVPNVYWNGKKLKNKTDYKVTYLNWDQKSAGEYLVQIDGNGNYDGTRIIPVTVTPKGIVSVSKLKITALNVPYTELKTDFRTDILKKLVIKNGKTELILGTDYEYVEGTERNCTEIGSCTFNIVGKNGYDGERTVTVRITGTSITDKKVTEVNTTVYRYTGDPLYLSENFRLKYNGTEIDPSNYEIDESSYKNNVNAGTATVNIIGKNEYYGTRTVKYAILPITTGITANDVTIETAYYSKGGSTPKVTVKDLKQGTDYTVKYTNNKTIGIGTVIITGTGNYKGLSLSKTFRINQKAISETVITATDMVFNSKGGKYRSTPVLTDTDGKKLKAGTDYLKTYKYELVTEDGEVIYQLGTMDVAGVDCYVKVTVTGTGNYTGEASVIYRILNKGMDISKAKVTAVPKEYTGKEVTLREEEIVVTLGGAVLNPGIDYEIIPDSYVKNINKGTGKATIRGIGYYGGVKTVSFKIGQRSIIDYWNGIMSFFTTMF